MRLHLHGGFAEKGRTCLGVEVDGYRLLLDAGVKTSASGADYYPAISPEELRATDALVITHAHEDHVAALGWCIAEGFRGRLLMSAGTRREADLFLHAYAAASHRQAARDYPREELTLGVPVALGPLQLVVGRSGHVSGGVWCAVSDDRSTLGYCGDVVPASEVFAMDPLPACDAIVLDASYSDDNTPARERAQAVHDWIVAHPQGCVLPTPLSGRSAELLAIAPGAVALSEGMRDALEVQMADPAWLADAALVRLGERLAAATDWKHGSALPRAALICHDGMGIAGPSRELLRMAAKASHPVLFTGHLPTDSPGEKMLAAGRADWLRLPTHPILSENAAIAAASNAKTVLGHSCDRAALERLKKHIPLLRADLGTGDRLMLRNG
jgi:glyoxylase-like metal-dependent hydrolase (beta-lactamase superfamily II)